MLTAYGASLDTIETAFIPIELTALSHGYDAGAPDDIDRAAAVLAAELLARVCSLDSLEHSSRLTAPARAALHAVLCLATASPLPPAEHPLAVSSLPSLVVAEDAITRLRASSLAPYLARAYPLAYQCLVHGSHDPRVAAAADAVLARQEYPDE